VDDFGALNSALPDPEPTPAEAMSGVALEPTPETAEDAPDAPASSAAGEDLPPEVAEGALMPPQLLRRVLKIPQRWRWKQQRKQRRSQRRRLPQRQGLRRWRSGCRGLEKFVYVAKFWLLRRFKILGLRTQPLLLNFWQLRPRKMVMNVVDLHLSFLILLTLGARLSGLRSRRRRIWTTLRPWMWLRRRLRRTPRTQEMCQVLAPGDDDEGRLRSVELVGWRGLGFV
jgi:hypothetical protein